MASKVYANGMEVSGKASAHKVLGSMPDVCLSPPSPPAGPIPIPYPNFAQASDTTSGSKKVKAGGKEINLKGKSKYKKSKGDEAATRSFGAGLISHSISGAVKHKAGSFDVKVEGSSVVRNLDLTTGNHSNPGDGCMTVDAAAMVAEGNKDEACEALGNKNEAKRKEIKQEKESTTVTHATYTNANGVTGEMAASSRILAAKYSNALSTGLGRTPIETKQYKKGKYKGKSYTVMESEKTNVNCDKAKAKNFSYRQRKGRPHTSHTESRIIETIFAAGGPAPGGKLLLNIDWNKKKGKDPQKKPCKHCQRLICAVQACGLVIELCQGDPPKPTPPKKCKPPNDLS